MPALSRAAILAVLVAGLGLFGTFYGGYFLHQLAAELKKSRGEGADAAAAALPPTPAADLPATVSSKKK